MAKKKGSRRISNKTNTEKPEKLNNNINSFDGFSSAFGGGGNLGSSEQISNTNTLFVNLRWYTLSNFRQLLSQLYVEIGLIQTIVDVPVDDGLRGGIMIKSKQLDESQIKDLQIQVDRDNDLNTIAQAAKWNRLFGGAGIIILIGDQDPELPLDINAIGPDSELEFRACDLWELFFDNQNTEGYYPDIQDEEYEFFDYYGQKVHKSRVMKLKGIEAPSFIRPRLRGWGVSIVESIVRSINQYLKASDLTFEVLDEFKVDVYKIKNLVNTLLSPNGKNKVKQTIQESNWRKNYQNAIVMDSEDDWDHKQLSFAGLAEAQAGIRKQVAADLRMPITKLFGSSDSGGIGTTDQNDMENYNSVVESQVRNKLKYDIVKLLEIKCQSLFGFIPDDLEIEFKPLRVLSAEQEENVKTQKFARLLQAKQIGEISTQEFRDACNKGNLFDVQLDTSEDVLTEDDAEITDIVKDKPTEQDLEIKPEYSEESTQNEVKPFTAIEKFARSVNNSSEFDRASYEADGGDMWVDERRKILFEKPNGVDESLWKKAEDSSYKVYGESRWQFVLWMYKKLGGRFK